MSASRAIEPRMSVDEFLVWAAARPGRYELEDGIVVAMSPERTRHARTKAAAHVALTRAIEGAALPCEALPDGMTVRIDEATAYEPDALVYCGERLSGDAVEVVAPVIIVEVLSPGSRSLDVGTKFHNYWTLPSISHVVLVDPKRRTVIHHARTGPDALVTRILKSGDLVLDPPGLLVPVSDLLGPPED